LPVIRTVSIVWYVYTGIINFIANILCTANAIITGNWSSDLAGTSTVTSLIAVAVQSVCTGGGCRRVSTVCLAAACGGTVGGPVITGLTCFYCPIPAYCRLITGVGALVTGFTGLAGITGGITIRDSIAILDTGAELSVIRTVGIVWRIDTGIIYLIT